MYSRLATFYEKLDNIMTDEVWSVDIAIDDGDMNESEKRTFENYGADIYFILASSKDFRFLTKDFMMQEIYKYFKQPRYWSEMREKYKVE